MEEQRPDGRGPGGPGGPPTMNRDHGPMDHGPGGPPGKWWMDPGVVQQIGLTEEQQKKIEGIFQQSRLRLIDLSASLQKEQAVMESSMEADHPDEAKVVQQIDRVAQARAELEKANARMLLGFRNVLQQDQWKKLQAGRPGQPRDFHRP